MALLDGFQRLEADIVQMLGTPQHDLIEQVAFGLEVIIGQGYVGTCLAHDLAHGYPCVALLCEQGLGGVEYPVACRQ